MAEPAWIFLLALLTAVATGLGALPFLFVALFTPCCLPDWGSQRGRWSGMVFSELVPDALEETDGATVAVVVALSVATLVAFQFLIRH